MQRDILNLDAFGFQLIEQLRRKMQTGCRRRGGTFDLGVNRLITLRILQLFLDIWRQRNIAQFFQNLIENTVVDHPELTQPFFADPDAFRFQLAFVKRDDSAQLDHFGVADQTFPLVAFLPQKQQFDVRAGFLFRAEQPGWNDARVVAHQHVARF